MKRRLLLVGLMCLVTVCTWAKDMTVLITDSKDLPIPGLQAFISGTGSDIRRYRTYRESRYKHGASQKRCKFLVHKSKI